MENDGIGQRHPQQLIFENVSPATRLLEKRRQMYEVQDALESQKARFAKEEEQFRKKEDQLRAKDLQLQHQLIRFNKFLQDNEAKRRRAETRAAEEAAQIKQREEEIEDLEHQLEESRRSCAELEEEVTKNMKFEEFLERVKDTCDDYSEIQDLVTRYDTLESANKDLMDNQTQFEARNEVVRVEFQNYKKERAIENMAFTNRIATMQSQFEEAQKARQELEHLADVATQEDSEHSLHFGQILMSVENLFLRCTTKRKNIQHDATPQDGEEQQADAHEEEDSEDSFRKKQQTAVRHLRVILAYLIDFASITETLKKERKAEGKRVIKEIDTEPSKLAEPDFKQELPPHLIDGKGATQSGSNSNTHEVSQKPKAQESKGESGVVASPEATKQIAE
jgi:hypothetical protein